MPNRIGMAMTAALVLVGIVIAILVFTGPSILDASRQKPKVEAAFRSFSQALVDHRIDDAYAICGDSFRRATPLAEFSRQQNVLEEHHGRLQSVEQGSLEITVLNSGSSPRRVAILQPIFHYTDGTQSFAFELREENGQWRVWAFRQL
jgi:hypothetical protein